MGATHVLPPPLDAACSHGHPLELWILVNGEIVQCAGSFMRTDNFGRPQVSATLPEDFTGSVRNGAAVRGFFTDDSGQVHTFLTSINDWQAYSDRPSAAKVVLETPTAVAPCQRRRGLRQPTKPIPVSLMVNIRGESEAATGRIVDVSPTGFAVRVVRAARNWFAEGTLLSVELDVGDGELTSLAVTVARVEREALHYLYGLRVNNSAERRALQDILDELLTV
ncbi:MAG: PilZ domain-containing protein [Planctomycetota bacterium]|jgi:hypothetical protein|nr:PilZ domain-containing protein [Planctomycetota bacterium]